MNKIVLSGGLIINEEKELLLLYRDKHEHYETPGGKVELEKCQDPENPSIEELKRDAKREILEELGQEIILSELKYFGKVEFTIPDGRKATANKFTTRIISGKPRLNEPELFSKLDYLPIKNLENYPISPDLKLLLPKIKEKLLQ